ncbi:MAG TPA: LEA type 2 family protein [Flavipsychrobacter sp.]|nr:LEA type 2 family protein [Flavipsychrobacter sp.]
MSTLKISMLALSITVLLGFESCKQPKDLIYQDVENFQIRKAALDNSAIAFDIKFYNPNNRVLKLKHADVEIYINDNNLGEIAMDEHYAIPKLDTFLLPVLLNVNMKNVLPNALQLLLNKEVDIKLKGTVKAGRGFGYINIPVNYEGKQQLNINL